MVPGQSLNSVVVLGGGITGLSSAFHLSRRFPHARITLLEKSPRIGGWIRSRRAEVKDSEGRSAQMLLEAGPRTLRPNSMAVLELINLLGLQKSVITTPKSSAAAKHRFLHIPGRPGLVRLPSSPFSLLTNPFTSSLLVPPIISEVFRHANRPEGYSVDESVDSFLSRRFGARFARIFGSAVVHGIYATDSRLLSVRAAFPMLLEAEERGGGSLVRGMLKAGAKKDESAYDVGEVKHLMQDASVFSFVNGMETLPNALREALSKNPNVTLRSNVTIRDLRMSDDSKSISVRLSEGGPLTFSHAVSALPLPVLSQLTSSSGSSLPYLDANPASSVTVVNIVFPPTKRPIHPPGFGYLVPRPAPGAPPTQVSGFLGTVFDSCALAAQDRFGDAASSEPSQKLQTSFTKLTVMLGGPHALTPSHAKAENVLAQLQHHLAPMVHAREGARLPWPVYYEAIEQRDCIPVPTVGHVQRMDDLRQVLKKKDGYWGGRLEVVGAGVGGVSVGDCVEAGREVGKVW